MLLLDAEQRAGATRLVRVYYEGTARSSRAFDDGIGTRVIVSTLGPGSLGGDRLQIVGQVGAGAHLIVESQSATKIYGPGTSKCFAHWTVAEGATLELRTEPLLLFGTACYEGRTEIELAPTARISMLECIAQAENAPARARLITTIRRGERLALRDAIALDTERLQCSAVGTFVGFGGELRVADADDNSVRIGTGSTLQGGLFLRAIGRRVWDVRARLASAYSLPQVLPFCDIK
ncbi:MAG TPA: urease accessory protein UreD [Candidatus Baltobacteraceae bacterium]